MSTSLSSISSPLVPIATPGSGLAPVSRAGETPDEGIRASVEEQERKSGSSAPPGDGITSSSAQASSGERAQQRQDQQVLRQLGARDREVRQHELAHQAAGGAHTGAASYSYERGPDGRMYAVGGEVSIDTSSVSGDPGATLEKAEAIIRAAMAPAEPSSQDHQVAASARAMAAEARAELARMDEAEQADAAKSDAVASGENTDAESAEAAEKAGSSATDSGSPAFSPASASQPLNAVQQQLVDSGVYASLYPSGSLVNLQA